MAERALRGLAFGRKSCLFAGSERGAERVAATYTLIQTAKLNDVDPRAWIAETPQSRLADLLPWNCRLENQKAARPQSAPKGLQRRRATKHSTGAFAIGTRTGSARPRSGCRDGAREDAAA